MRNPTSRSFIACARRAAWSLAIASVGLAGSGCGGTSSPGQGVSPRAIPPEQLPPSADAPPDPRIFSVWPNTAPAGSPDLLLTVTGSDFAVEGHHRTVVVWSAGGADSVLVPSSASPTELTVTLPAELMSVPVEAAVNVQDIDPASDQFTRAHDPVGFIVAATDALAYPLAFESVGSMRTPRSGHTATLLDDGKVLLLGGGAEPEVFDPADASFVPTGDMVVPRNGSTAVKLRDGRVLVAGGPGPSPKENGDLHAEIYDPVTGAFQLTGSLHEYHDRPTATLLADGRVLFAGGAGPTRNGQALNGTEVFDPGTSSFTVVGPMSARAQHAAVLLPSGEVLIVGGRNGYRPDSADDSPWDPTFAELFDPVSGTFRRSADMGTTRIDPAVTLLRDGRVLVLGGFGDDLQNLHEQPVHPAYAQVYDRASQQFTTLGLPRLAETQFTMTLLPDGKVMLIGGTRAGKAVDAVRLIDPMQRRLFEVGHLMTPRTNHTTTLLHDGRVLVIGGTDAGGNVLATAEISSRSLN